MMRMPRGRTPQGIEAELIPVECAAMMDEVAHSVRHDMNNRLASIRNAAGYLRDRVEETALWTEDSRVPRFFGLIDHAVDNAKELLSDRLHVETLFARRAEHVDASEIVSRAAREFAMSSTIALELETDPGVELFADRGELMLLVVLLLRNAVEAQPNGGRVRVRLVGGNESAVFEVLDEGPGLVGITAHDALMPYTTTKMNHVGLGLPIARRIAHRYGGRLELVESENRARVRVAFSGGQYAGVSSPARR